MTSSSSSDGFILLTKKPRAVQQTTYEIQQQQHSSKRFPPSMTLNMPRLARTLNTSMAMIAHKYAPEIFIRRLFSFLDFSAARFIVCIRPLFLVENAYIEV